MCCLHCGVRARPDATVWVDFDVRRRPTVLEAGPVDLVDAGIARIIRLYFYQCDWATFFLGCFVYVCWATGSNRKDA